MSGLPFQQHGGEASARPPRSGRPGVADRPLGEPQPVRPRRRDDRRRPPRRAALSRAGCRARHLRRGHRLRSGLLVLTNGGAEAIAGVARLVGAAALSARSSRCTDDISAGSSPTRRAAGDPTRRARSGCSPPITSARRCGTRRSTRWRPDAGVGATVERGGSVRAPSCGRALACGSVTPSHPTRHRPRGCGPTSRTGRSAHWRWRSSSHCSI